jgi:hypothetical protein
MSGVQSNLQLRWSLPRTFISSIASSSGAERSSCLYSPQRPSLTANRPGPRRIATQLEASERLPPLEIGV